MTRIAARLVATLRTSWKPAAWAVAGGLLLEAVFPVGAPALPAIAAAGFAALAVLLFALAWWLERRSPPPGLTEADEGGLGRNALLERWSTPAQLGYAFGAGALVLLGLALGFGIARLAGL